MPDSIPVRSIWTLITVDVFARISYGLARTPVLPLYAACLGASPEMIGFVGAAATLTGIAIKLPSGAISDVVGRRPLLVAGLAVFAIGPILYLFVDRVWELAGVRFFHGFATALYGPVAMAAVAALAADRKGEYLSWLSNAKILGKLLGAFLGGLILSLAAGPLAASDTFRNLITGARPDAALLDVSDFHLAYGICAFLGVLALGLGFLVLRDLGQREKAGGERRTFQQVWIRFRDGIRETASDIRVLLASGSEGVQNITVGVLEHFLPVYAVLIAGRTPLEAGLLWAGQMGTTILCKPMFGRHSDRRGRRGLIAFGMVICALPFAAVPWVTGFWPLMLLCLVFGLGEALVTSSSAAFVGDLCRSRSLGAAMGVFGTIKDSGHALGPILGGVLISLFAGTGAKAFGESGPVAFRATFVLVAAVVLAYAAVFFLVMQDKGIADIEKQE